MSRGHLIQRIQDVVANLLIERYERTRVRETAPGRCRIVAAVLPRQKTSGKRAPDQNADVVVLGERLELEFEASADKAVVHLRGHESLQPQAALQPERGGRLPRHKIGETDVADLSLAHEIIERAESLLQRSIAVPSVHLVYIDIVGLQPREAALHLAKDVHTRRAAAVEVLTHGKPDLGG